MQGASHERGRIITAATAAIVSIVADNGQTPVPNRKIPSSRV
jgi:hypothetical protein